MTNERIGQLADMAVYHVIYGRTDKAIKILQAIRAATQSYCPADTFDFRTGRFVSKRTTRKP